MKTKHLLKNKSGSSGIYVLNGIEKVLPAGQSVILDIAPTSVTKNIVRSTFTVVEQTPVEKPVVSSKKKNK